MGKICSFCGYTYGFGVNGRRGLQQPRGNELCGELEHFCNNPEAGFERLKLEHQHMSPEDKKKWQRQVDEHKHRKSSWEAEQRKLGVSTKLSARGSRHGPMRAAYVVYEDDPVLRPLVVDRPANALLKRPGHDVRVAYTGIETDYLARRGSHARSRLT